MTTMTFKSIHSLALTGALALAAFAGGSIASAGDAEARGFHGRGGGRMFHGGHLGGRHAFHHRHWRHHRWGWRGPALIGGVAVAGYAGGCYAVRQRVWSDAYGAYVIRRVPVCE